MFLIGSLAAKYRGYLPSWRHGNVSDMDLVGRLDELEYIKKLYKPNIIRCKESDKYKGKFTIILRDGSIEFDATENTSNLMYRWLPDNKTTRIAAPCGSFNVEVVSAKTAYLIKRSHINYPVHWHKNYRDLIWIAKHISVPRKLHWHSVFSPAHADLYNELRVEAEKRYSHMQDKIKLDKPVKEFFEASSHLRKINHDRIHEIIAFSKDFPQYKKIQKDPASPLLDFHLFDELSYMEKKVLFQEEAAVIGIERYWLNNQKINESSCYRYGAAKVLFSLSKGWFQDWGLDHIHLLQDPLWPFLERFKASEEYKETLRD